MQQDSASKRLKSICFGTLINTLAVTPLDVLKVRLQSQLQPQPSAASRRLICTARHHHHTQSLRSEHLEGILDGICKITRSEGFFKLWRGFTPTLVMAVPNTVIYFNAYQQLRDLLQNAGYGHFSSLIAGSSARTLAVACISPIELFRTRMQSFGRRGTFLDVYRSMVSMVSADGIGSLWRGLPPTLWRDVPFSGIYWFTYEALRGTFVDIAQPGAAAAVQSSNGREFVNAFSCGAVAGAVAAALTTPFDVVKTIRQVSLSRGETEPFSLVKMLVQLWRREGIAGLTKGIEARVAKCAPSCAVLIGCFELGKKIF